jgi:Cu2+-exporting ATPase
MAEDFKRRFWISLILTVPVLILSPMIQEWLGIAGAISFRGDIYVIFALSSLIFFYGGYPFLKGLYDELSDKSPGMMTLIGLATSVAYIYSSLVVFGLEGKFFFWELATLIDVMLVGHWVEMKSVMGASRAIEELGKLMPSNAHRITPDGETEDVPVDEIKEGDKLLVKPGEKVPADGVITEGETSVDESVLTGESKPAGKTEGDEVIGGSINGDSSITIEVEKTGGESFVSKVMSLVEEAQKSKSRAQDVANRAALWLTIIALSAGAITIFAWLVLVNRDLAFSLERSVTVMVITCPHALGLAIPLVIAVSTAIAAQNGLLIRNRVAFEKARGVDAVIFDKTGTLTEGKFAVDDAIALEGDTDAQEILDLAAAVESHSEHPIAKGIAASAKESHEVKDFKAIPGKGARGTVKGKKIEVVSEGYLEENDISFDESKLDQIDQKAKTLVFVLLDDAPKGIIALSDVIRSESKDAISALTEMGVKSMMVTGDNEEVARWVAEELGLDEYFAGVLPDQKASKVKDIQSRGLVVAMTGDGVNDAPALAQADIGVAIGAGTDVAVETADIVLVRSNPMDMLAAVRLAQATYRKTVQNLIWATGYNAFAIPLAAGVLYKAGILLSPAVGAILMSLSTVIVAINAKILRFER